MSPIYLFLRELYSNEWKIKHQSSKWVFQYPRHCSSTLALFLSTVYSSNKSVISYYAFWFIFHENRPSFCSFLSKFLYSQCSLFFEKQLWILGIFISSFQIVKVFQFLCIMCYQELHNTLIWSSHERKYYFCNEYEMIQEIKKRLSVGLPLSFCRLQKSYANGC